ncbi:MULTISPECIES: ribbon-helix-helix domain-containing protein [Acinetobacter calcoaceticus/baumannii complex]|uniref:ribbon-helix-helix domain-containing protein n=1 Tax=Acinetobacter calcoaceticus/baumannii complex TaxID=909768 RepID=UPI001D18AB97|nr:ribbon-helix-helix domain-containing protein [Acinetobacter baumannii]MCC8263084.1 ribbon-helix-helix domain-containing protein [Acinetobacter baumannii]MCC8272636.1 ribbon-helix-helix domain-containing protein [Acinetobacter baumannii]MCC8298399.1 ribbon-helix-helix domain-containing protein [Acinetobacter baumannii]MCC8322926.1 ribbon-helix-helix domain-containing protein [Acinetobacter baumannii]MCC8326047.1 ribbon-helix-helix domain-containing protein [Acinetobacter baumannii]
MAKQNQQQLKIRFFDDADHLKLKEIAEKEDRSLTYVVNQAIKQFLQSKESAKA